MASLMKTTLKLALLNTTIATCDGVFKVETISLEQARKLVRSAIQNAWEDGYADGIEGLDSAIGHESTAKIMSTLLEVDIPVNRQMFKQQPGQRALVFKLNGRPPEGKILSAEEIEAIGYSFKLMTLMQPVTCDERDIGQAIVRA